VDRLILGVLAHPGDHDLVLISEDQVHAPVSVEAPLADVVIVTHLGAHAGTAGLAAAVSKLLNDSLEALLGLSAQRLDSSLTATRDADLELGRHGQTPRRCAPVPSELYGVAGESVPQSIARSGLRERSLIGRLTEHR
jgi:hypothetical protein